MPEHPSGAWLTRQLRRAEAHADKIAPLLEAAIAEVLAEVGNLAAAAFTAQATSLTAAAPGVTSASTMICLKPTPEQAAALALDGGEPAENLHVTLAYLGETTGPLYGLVDVLRPFALEYAALTGVVGGIGTFSDVGDGYPILALPDVPGLNELRAELVEELDEAGVDFARTHGFCPHITLAYRPAPAFVAEALGVPLTFGELLIVRGDTEIIPLPLAGTPPVTAAGPVVLRVPLPEGSRIEDLIHYTPLSLGRPVPPDWHEEAAGLEFRPIRDSPAFANKMVHDHVPLGVGCAPDCPLCAASPTLALEPVPGAPGWQVDLAPIQPLLDRLKAEKARETVYDRIRVVAEAHRPEGGYGDTWFRYDDHTVFWECGDWTTNEELDAAEAAFLAIEGVDRFEHGAEEQPTSWRLIWARSMTAAGPLFQWLTADAHPPFIPPGADEVINVDALIARITARIRPVRDAAVAAAGTTIVESIGLAWDVTNPFVGNVLAQSGSQIVDIAHTTQLNVMRIIRASYREGLSIPHTAEAIRSGMADASPARARLIARTELAGAVNGGSLAAVRIVEGALGIAYHKVWMTAPGAKHPRHFLYDGLNGQARVLAGKFQVGGAELDHPGDAEGPPGEICNCRCAMRYAEGPPPLP